MSADRESDWWETFEGFNGEAVTWLPGELFDTMHELTSAEFVVLSYIARRTVGVGCRSALIALEQFETGTGMTGSKVTRALRGLLEKGKIALPRQGDSVGSVSPAEYEIRLAPPRAE